VSSEQKKGKPNKLVIDGEEYPAVVVMVTGRDATGRPREGRFLYEEESINLKGGEEFLIVFANGKSIAKRS
jgi:uncharacterized protein YacL (UPF0231 family)